VPLLSPGVGRPVGCLRHLEVGPAAVGPGPHPAAGPARPRRPARILCCGAVGGDRRPLPWPSPG